MSFPPSLIPLALAGLLLAPLAHAESRAASAQERAAFDTFYRARFGAGASLPPLKVERMMRKGPWTLSAQADAAPRRARGALCRMERYDFTFDRVWRAAPPRQLVWLDAKACRPGTAAVELLQRMPDTDVIGLLERATPKLLEHARLVMAGNSACAIARSVPFALAAIDVDSPGAGTEQMAALVYRGDVGTSMNVWMRRSGATLDLWTVSCPSALPL